jgi:hypothetical protein
MSHALTHNRPPERASEREGRGERRRECTRVRATHSTHKEQTANEHARHGTPPSHLLHHVLRRVVKVLDIRAHVNLGFRFRASCPGRRLGGLGHRPQRVRTLTHNTQKHTNTHTNTHTQSDLTWNCIPVCAHTQSLTHTLCYTHAHNTHTRFYLNICAVTARIKLHRFIRNALLIQSLHVGDGERVGGEGGGKGQSGMRCVGGRNAIRNACRNTYNPDALKPKA